MVGIDGPCQRPMIQFVQVLIGALVGLGVVFLIKVVVVLIPGSTASWAFKRLGSMVLRVCSSFAKALVKLYQNHLQAKMSKLAIRLIAFLITLVFILFEYIAYKLKPKQTRLKVDFLADDCIAVH